MTADPIQAAKERTAARLKGEYDAVGRDEDIAIATILAELSSLEGREGLLASALDVATAKVTATETALAEARRQIAEARSVLASDYFTPADKCSQVAALLASPPTEKTLNEVMTDVACDLAEQVLAMMEQPEGVSPPTGGAGKEERCLTREEQKAQAARCSCRGTDEWCVCQNSPDHITRKERADV